MKFDLPERFFTLVGPVVGQEYRVRVFDTSSAEYPSVVRTTVPYANATGSVHARALGLERIVRNFPNSASWVDDEGVVWKDASLELRDYLEDARKSAWDVLVDAVGAAMRSKFEAETDPASWSVFVGAVC